MAVRVLVVDPDLVSRARLWRALSTRFQVEVVLNHDEAVQRLHADDFDAVLCSHDPDCGQHGSQLARACRAIDADVALLVLTEDGAPVDPPDDPEVVDAWTPRVGPPALLLEAIGVCVGEHEPTPVRVAESQPAPVPPPSADERRAPRHDVEWPLELAIHFDSWAGFGTAYTRNVSRCGLMLQLPNEVALEQALRVTLRLPNGERPVFDARVRRVVKCDDGFEVGLEFVDLSLEQEQSLAQALDEAAAES